MDRRRGAASGRRVQLATVESCAGTLSGAVLDLNVRHFHEKLAEEARRPSELHLGQGGQKRAKQPLRDSEENKWRR